MGMMVIDCCCYPHLAVVGVMAALYILKHHCIVLCYLLIIMAGHSPVTNWTENDTVMGSALPFHTGAITSAYISLLQRRALWTTAGIPPKVTLAFSALYTYGMFLARILTR